MSLAIQEAYHMLGTKPYFDLITKSLDGDEFYALNAHLLGDVEIMWLRPTSTIKGKVQKALTYLIIFSVLVLVFDCLVSASEVFFIAMPLKKLEFAIDQIGAMRTEAALEVLAEFEKMLVAVWEIRRVFAGMLTTTKQLQEYKAFMPQSVLYASTEEELTISERTSRAASEPRNVMNTSAMSRRSGIGSSLVLPPSPKINKTETKVSRRACVTVVCAGIRGFHDAVDQNPDLAVATHTRHHHGVEEAAWHRRRFVRRQGIR